MNKKKKILWIGDDIRMNSGVSTAGRELILSTCHKYDFVCLGGAITHPEKGKVFDLSQSIMEQKKIKDVSVKIIPVDGYGNEQIIMQIIAAEKIDAICMITDPRFYGFLFSMERQLRANGIPICYWALWDDILYPMYNRPFYESCDAIFAISKQSNNIHQWVLDPLNCCTIDGLLDKNGDLIKNK